VGDPGVTDRRVYPGSDVKATFLNFSRFRVTDDIVSNIGQKRLVGFDPFQIGGHRVSDIVMHHRGNFILDFHADFLQVPLHRGLADRFVNIPFMQCFGKMCRDSVLCKTATMGIKQELLQLILLNSILRGHDIYSVPPGGCATPGREEESTVDSH